MFDGRVMRARLRCNHKDMFDGRVMRARLRCNHKICLMVGQGNTGQVEM